MLIFNQALYCLKLAHLRTPSPRGSAGYLPPRPKAMPVQDGFWVQTWIWMPTIPGSQPMFAPPGLPAVPPFVAPPAGTHSKAAAPKGKEPEKTEREPHVKDDESYSEAEDCSSKLFF